MTSENALPTQKHKSILPSACVYAMLCIISGIYGFIYEIIFYYINGDMQTVYWRGSHFLPWITIYSFGGIVIYLLTIRLKKHPLLVTLAGGLGCGALELIGGAALYYMFDNTRAWDYNTEKWNFGNIGGFICLRSVAVFALSSLLLIYVIYPFILRLRKKLGDKVFCIIALSVTGVFLADFLYNAIAVRVFSSLPNANEFYVSLGMSVLKYY